MVLTPANSGSSSRLRYDSVDRMPRSASDAAGLPRLKVIQVEAGKPTVSVLAFAQTASALGLEFKLETARRPTLEELPDFLR